MTYWLTLDPNIAHYPAAKVGYTMERICPGDVYLITRVQINNLSIVNKCSTAILNVNCWKYFQMEHHNRIILRSWVLFIFHHIALTGILVLVTSWPRGGPKFSERQVAHINYSIREIPSITRYPQCSYRQNNVEQ